MKTKHHPILSTPVTQSGGKTLNNTVRRKWFALGLSGFLFISVCALSPSPAKAQCAQYDVSGQWTIQQGSYLIAVALSQNGKTISGTAKQNWVADHQVRELHGQVTGTIAGDHFAVNIYWNNNTIGVYNATIDPQGTIAGIGYEKRSPSVKVNWGSDTTMKCADAINPRKVIKSFPKPTATVTSTPLPVKTYDANDPNRPRGFINGIQLHTPTPSAAANPAAPRITASPANGTGGSTTLTWDGGPEHPYAEVWVGVDGGDPTFMVEQGKGSRRVTVEPGKTYRYILTDSGKDLSTVTVRGK